MTIAKALGGSLGTGVSVASGFTEALGTLGFELLMRVPFFATLSDDGQLALARLTGAVAVGLVAYACIWISPKNTER